jgi:hypothetical protein
VLESDLENWPGFPDSVASPKSDASCKTPTARSYVSWERSHAGSVDNSTGVLRSQVHDHVRRSPDRGGRHIVEWSATRPR